MSYSMSYTWYDVTCNAGICKSKSTLRDTSYHIRRMTGWALSYCGMRVARCALYHKVILHCDVTPRYAVTSLHIALWRHSALRCDVTTHYAVTWLFTRKTTSYKTYTCQNHASMLRWQTSNDATSWMCCHQMQMWHLQPYSVSLNKLCHKQCDTIGHPQDTASSQNH